MDRRRPTLEPWLTPARLLSLVAALVAAYATLVVVRALRDLLTMLLLALFLSFAMEPAVQWLAYRGWRRGAATGLVFLAVSALSAGFVAAMAPLVVDQVSDLVRSVPRSLEELNRMLAGLPFGLDLEASPEFRRELFAFANRFGAELRNVTLGAASNVISLGATALEFVFQLLTVGLVTFYLVADGPRFRRALATPLPPERQRELLTVWELAVAKTGGYIYSRLLLAAVCAGAHFVFLLALGVPYPVPLSLWVGVTSAFIPVVGTYLGGVLVLLVAFINQPVDALLVLVFVAVYQQVENYLLAPRIQAHTMEVHPAVAFVSVLVGATLLGAVGALLALPATAIIQALLSTYVQRHEVIAELDELPPAVSEDAKAHLTPQREAPA
ncbi:MAG TPA: AI-2E family transporter [Egibacteraceae bacterium]|nr:AI-2E family transporter [Actinomycetota bacterium]HWB72102.1 AI-2E family transporter [Egibacteraceae bacterium]